MKVTGIIHAHSTYSYDGKLSLEELKRLLFSRGHAFCCVTEHTDEMTEEQAAEFVKECFRLSDKSFVFIPGFEVPYKDAHVMMIGTEAFLGQFADEHLLARWADLSEWVVLAHPVRNHFEVDAPLLAAIDAIEVWNQQYDGKAAPRFRSLRLLADLQLDRPDLHATGGIDLHRSEHYGSPIIELEPHKLDEINIVHALRLGYYTIAGKDVAVSSTGVFKRGGGLLTRLASRLSIIFIGIGKTMNAMLALIGLRLPRTLTRAVRGRV